LSPAREKDNPDQVCQRFGYRCPEFAMSTNEPKPTLERRRNALKGG
jgi:hypothetical protein